MIKRHYKKGSAYIEKNRFVLLLFATLFVLILPAFVSIGILREILFVASLSFLFIQSMIVATTSKKQMITLRYAVVVIMMLLFWLDPLGLKWPLLDEMRLVLMSLFFIFITYYLLKFMRKAKRVNGSVIITAVNIYLLMGIVFASLAFLFYKILPEAYNFPDYITEPAFVQFNYYSFITMSTVGYGDITPRIPQTQTLGYLIAITGQLYVAIIIAFLVGKLLVSAENAKDRD
jgi:voltage-gated potassium channel